MSTPLLGVAQESIKKSEIEAVISPDYGKVHIIKKGFGGTISTAVKLNTDLKVIVKSVDKDAAPDWWKEVAILRRICHPNVVKVYDVYETDYHVHIIQEYCSKGSLFREVKFRQRSLSTNTTTPSSSTNSTDTMNFKKIASVGDVPLVFKRAVQPPNNSQIHTSRPMVNLDKSRTASSKSATGDGPLVHVDKVSDSEIDIKVSRPDSSQTLQPSFKGAKREKSVQNFAAMLESEHMTSEELQSYLMQIAVTIAFLHKHGIVHGDIKLENIVITDTGIAKLIDFGMAVDTDARRKSIIFNGHDKPEGGTLGYSAPEHVTPRSGINTDGSEQSQSNSTRGDKIHSLPSFGDMVTGFIDGGSSDAAAVDAWAFGVVVFTSLLGKKPWTVATQKDPSFRRYMKSGFSAEDMECVPADLRTMLTRLLNINVERRYTMENAVTCMQQVWGFEHVPDEDDAFVNPAEGNLLGDLILESGKRMLAMFYEG